MRPAGAARPSRLLELVRLVLETEAIPTPDRAELSGLLQNLAEAEEHFHLNDTLWHASVAQRERRAQVDDHDPERSPATPNDPERPRAITAPPF